MRFARIGLCLSFVFMMLCAFQSQCYAQSYGDAFSSEASMTTPVAVKQEDGTVKYVERPLSFSCGTIGPQGGDATSIMGVNTAGVVRVSPQPDPVPVIPVFLASMLVISVVAYGLRTIALRKRAPLWVLGSIAAGLVALAGFMWASLSH